MSLKKYLKSLSNNVIHGKGQSTIEYFVLLTLVALLAIIGSTNFLSRVQQRTESFTNFAVNEMAPELEPMP